MTISETAICNQALTLLGATRITALTEDSKNARACNAVYEFVRNSVLTDHPWTFAQKRAALATVAGDPVWTDDLVTVIYQLPADFLQLNFINQENALVKIESDKLLSDTSSLKIKYTFEVTDTSKFKPKFVEALVAKLAAELAIPITNKSTFSERLFVIYYEKKLPQAISIDSVQGTPIQPYQDEWLNSRRIGSSQLVGRTSWETWYPTYC